MPTSPEVRIIDGSEHTNRAGIAHMIGRTHNTVKVLALTDPGFPAGVKQGRFYWYPTAQVRAYGEKLAARVEESKPPLVKDGNPDDLLDAEAGADAMGIKLGTFNRYVAESIPYWSGEKKGTPRIGRPDWVGPYVDRSGHRRVGRKWRRDTLARSQARRPGSATGGGETAAQIGKINSGRLDIVKS